MKFDEHVNVLVYNLFFFRIQIGTRKKLESILRQKNGPTRDRISPERHSNGKGETTKNAPWFAFSVQHFLQLFEKMQVDDHPCLAIGNKLAVIIFEGVFQKSVETRLLRKLAIAYVLTAGLFFRI